jgi:hypothetical protein
VTREEQLAWERRLGPVAAGAAVAAALLLLVQTFLVQFVVLEDSPETDRGALLALDDHAGLLVVSSVLQALGTLALLVVFWYLFRVTRHRRPELPAVFIWLVYAGPVLYALGGLLGALDRVDVADRFASGSPTSGGAGEERAEDLLDDPAVLTIAFSATGTLVLAILYVLISLNAMRAGVLSRFTGVLGIVVGALMVIPLVPGGSLIIEVFWLGALGALFLGRWPGGRGAAWESGTAEPWITPAQRRALEAGGAAQAEEPADAETPQRRSSRKRRRR